MFQALQKAATEGRSLSMNRRQDERVRSLVIRKELKEEPMFRCSQQRWLWHLVRMPPGEEFWACTIWDDTLGQSKDSREKLRLPRGLGLPGRADPGGCRRVRPWLCTRRAQVASTS